MSSRAFAISDDDAADLNRLKARVGLSGPDFETWPLNLEHVQNLFNGSVQTETGKNWTRPYLTMVANDHAENRRFVSELMTGGYLEQICNKTKRVPFGIRRLRVYFIGSISRYLMGNFPRQVKKLRKSCVRLKYDLSMQQLQEEVFPKTLALLNPFLDAVKSGISVKTFEAVAMGVPVVTSLAGFRGLEQCGRRLDKAGLLTPSTAPGYVDFISNRLVDPESAAQFSSTQRDILRGCVAEQRAEKKGVCMMKRGRGRQAA